MNEKDYMLINFGDKCAKLDKNLMITIKKTHNDLVKYAKEKSKGTKCWLCHKECTSFCNSHSIPRFILEKIAEGGDLENIFTSDNDELDSMMSKSGIRNTLTFNLICHDCDNQYFQEIEDDKKINDIFSELQLNKLAIKILLHYWYTKIVDANLEIESPKNQMEYNLNTMFQFKKENALLHVLECTEELNEHLDAIKNKTTIKYNKILDIIIDKEINFACNCEYVPMFDIYGKEVVNDLTNPPKKGNRFGYIYIVAYPIDKNKSHVSMFYRKKYSKYNIIRNQFDNLKTVNDKLQAISNVLVIHSDKFILKPKILKNKSDYIDVISYGTMGAGTIEGYNYILEKLKKENFNLFNL